MVNNRRSGSDFTRIEETMEEMLRKERYPVAEINNMATVIRAPIFACKENFFMGSGGNFCQSYIIYVLIAGLFQR
jgi:hypothetical protein